jgi:hypothetical protein
MPQRKTLSSVPEFLSGNAMVPVIRRDNGQPFRIPLILGVEVMPLRETI